MPCSIPTGRRFATACGDGIARVWDAATGEPVTPPLAHRRRVTRVAFSPDGHRLATACRDGTARVWDAATGRPVTYSLPHEARSATSASAPTAPAWPRPRPTACADLGCHHGTDRLPPLKHGPDVLAPGLQRRMAAGSPQARPTGRRGSGMRPPAGSASPAGAGPPVSCVAFRPDGRVLLTACSDCSFAECAAQQWDLSTGRPLGPPLGMATESRGRPTAPMAGGSPRPARTARPGSGTPRPASPSRRP